MHAWAIGALAALVVSGLGLALVLLRAPGRAAASRWAATWLVVDAVAAAALILTRLPLDAWTIVIATAASVGLMMAANVLFVVFVGALEGKASRVLRARPVRAALVALAVALAALPFVASTGMVVIERAPSSPSGFENAGVGFVGVVATAIIALPLGLLVLVALRREAPAASLERARAGIILVAMLIFQGYEAFQSVLMVALEAVSHDAHLAYMDGPIGAPLLAVGIPTAKVIGIAFLAYGVLKTELFDIDLRVRAGLVRSTIVAAFLVVFFVAEQAAQTVVSDAFGVAIGLGAAGLLVVAFRPLERAAHGLADRVMPRVKDTPEFRDAHKEEVYRTAVRAALADRVLTREEEAELAALAARLGFDPVHALRLRDEVEREMGVTLGDRAAAA